MDTNYVIALVDARDKRAAIAEEISRELKIKKTKAIHLDCVLNEVISVLGKRFVEKKRIEEFVPTLRILERLIPKEKITWVYPEVPRLYNEVLKVVEKYKGKLNFHDGLIVTAAKEMGINSIVSFDEDFDEIPELKRIGKSIDVTSVK
ncbi:MAG: type II toxin-antitoxin system VapC family toxin [bacterium]